MNIILVITTFMAESELCLLGAAAIQMNWKSNVMCHHYHFDNDNDDDDCKSFE